MRCASCNNLIPQGSKFCGACGAHITPQQEAAQSSARPKLRQPVPPSGETADEKAPPPEVFTPDATRRQRAVGIVLLVAGMACVLYAVVFCVLSCRFAMSRVAPLAFAAAVRAKTGVFLPLFFGVALGCVGLLAFCAGVRSIMSGRGGLLARVSVGVAIAATAGLVLVLGSNGLAQLGQSVMLLWYGCFLLVLLGTLLKIWNGDEGVSAPGIDYQAGY